MSSGCGDVLSLEDLKTAKKHQTFEAEVITGKQGGVAGGADIDYATNRVTGQTQKTLPAVLRDAGFLPASFDFSTGGTLTINDRNKVVYDPVSKSWYNWLGALPHVVAAGTNPVGDINWNVQIDPLLKNELADTSSMTKGDYLIGVKQPFSGSVARTQHDKNTDVVSVADFAGADPTGLLDCVAAFNAAAATGATVFIPKGVWLLSAATAKGIWLLDKGAYISGLADVGVAGIAINDTSRLTGSIIQHGGSTLTALRVGSSDPWLERNIRKYSESLAELVSKSSTGGIGALFASRASDNPAPNMQAIGSAHYGVNDNTANPETSWSAYFEAVRYAGAGPSFGAEMDFVNLGNIYDCNPFSPVDPYSSTLAATSSLWLSCGGGDSDLAQGANNISQAITLLPNSKKFHRGMVVRNGSLETGEIIAAPNDYKYTWYRDSVTLSSSFSDSYNIRKVWGDNAFSLDEHYRYKPTGTPTVAGDVLHEYRAFYYNGSSNIQGVTISSVQRTNFASGAARCSWVVSVANEGTGVTDVGVNGNGVAQFGPVSSDNAIVLGSASHRWQVVYAGTGSINTSDAREKTEPLPINDDVLDAWGDVNIITYQWLESIKNKGEDSARWHFGVIAQQVRDAFAARGIDGTLYGLLCYDEWGAKEAVYRQLTDIEIASGNYPPSQTQILVEPAVAPGNRWGVRPDQCFFMEAAYQRRRCDRIEERLSKIEGK